MNEIQLHKGLLINKKIGEIEEYIKSLEWTQNETVEIRPMRMAFNGCGNEVKLPETLFRIIGKLALVEYQKELSDLKKQFEQL